MKQAHEDSKKRYGAVKICRILNDSGTPCSVKHVQRHMAEQGLRSILVKKYNHHANHGLVPDNKTNILPEPFSGRKSIFASIPDSFMVCAVTPQGRGGTFFQQENGLKISPFYIKSFHVLRRFHRPDRSLRGDCQSFHRPPELLRR